MLDSDLARLYGVATKVLNQAVKRNIERFPDDFMLQLTWEEVQCLRSQFVTLNGKKGKTEGEQAKISKRGKHIKYLPYAFTEHGVAMLSSILNSKRAINVNIQIMRAFIKIRQFILTHKELAKRVGALELLYGEHDKKIKSIFEIMRRLSEPEHKEEQKEKIGFIVRKKE